MALALGVDLGGTNTRAAVVDVATGAVVSAHKEPHPDRRPEAVARGAAAAVRRVAAAAGTQVARVGVGLAGQCQGPAGLVLNAPNLGWRDVPFGELLGQALGAPVRLANDLSAAALGEHRFGAARGADDAVLLFVGSGIGAGLILGGRLHEGTGGVAGEIGHVKVRPPPGAPERRCGCGQLACLEAWAGGHAIAAQAREALAAGLSPGLAARCGGDPARTGASLVEEAAAGGDPWALEFQEQLAELLGDAAANLCTVLNPARLILGGGVLLGSPRLEGLVRARLQARVSASAARDLRVLRAALGDDAGLVGAALLAG